MVSRPLDLIRNLVNDIGRVGGGGGKLTMRICLFLAPQQPPVGQVPLIHEVSRSQRRPTFGMTPLDE
jgi:hypothetical protein